MFQIRLQSLDSTPGAIRTLIRAVMASPKIIKTRVTYRWFHGVGFPNAFAWDLHTVVGVAKIDLPEPTVVLLTGIDGRRVKARFKESPKECKIYCDASN